MGIGEKLNILLQKRERNINELAITINVSPHTLYSIVKRNNTKVDLDILQKIADELSVTLDYFCSDYKNNDEDALILNNEERKIIIAYRTHPEMQAAINKMLDIDTEHSKNTNNTPKRKLFSAPPPARIAASGMEVRSVENLKNKEKN